MGPRKKCFGCNAITLELPPQNHSEDCRRRFEKIMTEDEHTREQIFRPMQRNKSGDKRESEAEEDEVYGNHKRTKLK